MHQTIMYTMHHIFNKVNPKAMCSEAQSATIYCFKNKMMSQESYMNGASLRNA